MVSCREEARATSTRVFRWNEVLLMRSRHMNRLGLFTLTTETQITKKFPGNSEIVEEPPWDRKVIPFHLHHLDSRDSFQPMLNDLLSSTDQFLPESTHPLASQICSYLFYHYRFLSTSVLRSRSRQMIPLTVIAVHVQRARLVEFTSTEDLTYNLNPEEFSTSSDECYSDFESDIWKGKSDPELKYSPDLIALTDVMKRYLGVRNKIPTRPILWNEPAGLVEVKPQTGLEINVVQAEDGIMLDQNKCCQICLKEFSIGMEIVKAACSHIFHGNCVSKWLSKNDSCPMCRFVLLKLET